MTMTDPWAEAREALAAKQAGAENVANALLNLYRTNQPVRAAGVVGTVYQANDLDVWMILVGALCSAAVIAERRTAGGPLATATEQGMPSVDMKDVPWAVGVRDQMEAALAANDMASFANIALEGSLRAAAHDVPQGEIPFELEVRYMAQLDQRVLALVAAEAMRRLFNERRADERTEPPPHG